MQRPSRFRGSNSERSGIVDFGARDHIGEEPTAGNVKALPRQSRGSPFDRRQVRARGSIDDVENLAAVGDVCGSVLCGALWAHAVPVPMARCPPTFVVTRLKSADPRCLVAWLPPAGILWVLTNLLSSAIKCTHAKGHARWLSPKKRHARYGPSDDCGRVGLCGRAATQTAGDATGILLMQSFVRTLVGCPPVAVRVKDDSPGCAGQKCPINRPTRRRVRPHGSSS